MIAGLFGKEASCVGKEVLKASKENGAGSCETGSWKAAGRQEEEKIGKARLPFSRRFKGPTMSYDAPRKDCFQLLHSGGLRLNVSLRTSEAWLHCRSP